MATDNNPTNARRKILILDDDKEHCLSLVGILETKNLAGRIATSAAEAFKMIANERFDAVLIDYYLAEGANSARVVHHIKELSSGLNVGLPVVLMSGAMDSALVAKLKGKVASAIVKPIDAATLFARLEEAFELPRQVKKRASKAA